MNIDTLFGIDLFLYKILLTPKVLKDNITYRSSKKAAKRLAELKNEPRTETVYICGNGPSLAKVDLRDIKDDYIVVNDFYCFEKQDPSHPPKYYMVIDEFFLTPALKDRFQSIFTCNTGAKYVLTGKMKSRVEKEFPDIDAYYCCPWGKLFKHTKPQDFTKTVSRTWNIVSEAILFAIYLGYKDIRLLGCDYSVFAKNAHFYPQKQKASCLRKLLFKYCFTTQAHYEIQKYAEQEGVKITNMTRETLLDAYPIDENSPY